VTPDTILRWQSEACCQEVRRLEHATPRSPEHQAGHRRARDPHGDREPDLGYTRIRGGLKRLGHDVGRNTIKAILKDHGIEPAPERGTNTPWKTFLAAHWDGLAAADFFTVEVLTMGGLVRYVVFFVMKLKTRTVEIAGILRACSSGGSLLLPGVREKIVR
jgi:putative transposase